MFYRSKYNALSALSFSLQAELSKQSESPLYVNMTFPIHVIYSQQQQKLL